MSEAFSISNTYIFRGSNLDEIINAYNERRAALHQDPRYWTGSAWSDTAPTGSESPKCQSHAFISEIQQWIIDNCGSWMPPTITDYDGYDPSTFKRISALADDAGQDVDEYFFKTIVGGNLVSGSVYGFRRRLADGTWSRGIAQTGDYWTDIDTGWMAWDDVLACLSKLFVVQLSGSATYGTAISDRSAGDDFEDSIGLYKDCDTIYGDRTQANNAYDTDTGTEQAGPPRAWACVPSPLYRMESQSSSVAYYIKPSVVDQVSAINLYFVPETEDYATTFDGFGTGIDQENLMNFVIDLDAGEGGLMPSGLLLQVASGAAFGSFGGDGSGFQAKSDLTTPWLGIVVYNFTNSN